MENVTMKLAEFNSQLAYDQISNNALIKIRDCVQNALGCAVWGSTTKWAKIINEFLDREDDSVIYWLKNFFK